MNDLMCLPKCPRHGVEMILPEEGKPNKHTNNCIAEHGMTALKKEGM
jgi:hypothetical protein